MFVRLMTSNLSKIIRVCTRPEQFHLLCFLNYMCETIGTYSMIVFLTCIFIALYTIQIVSKQLYSDKEENIVSVTQTEFSSKRGQT